MAAYVYVLRCGDGTLYTGWTNDPVRRLKTHNAGRAQNIRDRDCRLNLCGWKSIIPGRKR